MKKKLLVMLFLLISNVIVCIGCNGAYERVYIEIDEFGTKVCAIDNADLDRLPLNAKMSDVYELFDIGLKPELVSIVSYLSKSELGLYDFMFALNKDNPKLMAVEYVIPSETNNEKERMVVWPREYMNKGYVFNYHLQTFELK